MTLVLMAPGQVLAQRLSLSNLVVDNQEGRIKVRFGLDLKDIKDLERILAEDRTLMLNCRGTLSISREYAWNKEVASAQLKCPLNLLADNGPYEIIVPGAKPERYMSRDLKQVLRQAWGEMALDLGDWSKLPRGQDYVLDLDISLTRQGMPSWVNGALFFMSFDALAPARYRLDFSY